MLGYLMKFSVITVPASGLAGIEWQGRLLRATDRLTSAERHYLRHVIHIHERPEGTALADYIASIREVILEERTGIFESRYQGRWQIGFIRRSGSLRGPSGSEWV